MVRLETLSNDFVLDKILKFTFQYGQIRNLLTSVLACSLTSIYIPVWLDQKQKKHYYYKYNYFDLHSSMVRLETLSSLLKLLYLKQFTFQYGQIRNFLF